MNIVEIVMLAVFLGLNVLFGFLGMRWMQRKGYPDSAWVILVLSICSGFVLPLLVVSFLPSRRRVVARRALPTAAQRPQARMPQLKTIR